MTNWIIVSNFYNSGVTALGVRDIETAGTNRIYHNAYIEFDATNYNTATVTNHLKHMEQIPDGVGILALIGAMALLALVLSAIVWVVATLESTKENTDKILEHLESKADGS